MDGLYEKHLEILEKLGQIRRKHLSEIACLQVVDEDIDSKIRGEVWLEVSKSRRASVSSLRCLMMNYS